MKKLIFISLIVLVSMTIAGFAMAGDTFGPGSTKTTQIAGANFIPSTGVYVYASAIDTNYCVLSVHTSAMGQASGKEFYGDNTSSAIVAKLSPPTVIDTCTAAINMTIPTGFQ